LRGKIRWTSWGSLASREPQVDGAIPRRLLLCGIPGRWRVLRRLRINARILPVKSANQNSLVAHVHHSFATTPEEALLLTPQPRRTLEHDSTVVPRQPEWLLVAEEIKMHG